MITIFPLQIFPQGVLADSVITTVWVGVFVVAFFNLRLGWVLSGLVVPGYIVPLIILKPLSVVVIICEGIITYFLVWLFSENLSRWKLWSNLFGRDRFFALLLVSVLVRIVMDGWLLPLMGSYLNAYFGIFFDYRNNLHSFGLIIVALVANQFWKLGIGRGIFQLLVVLFITYLIVRFVLMEMTNFDISNLSYMYEDIAKSMLASPKAYIILIITAFIASKMNLFYGWEFNGILIPALLALQWYQPTKILVSFVEAFVILGISSLILTLPMFKHASIEGARKLLLFFNVGFVYKAILAYALLNFLPNVKTTDFFAFGYLLSTLIAIKMHDKNILARLTLSTLQTSLVAVFLGSIIGYSLTFLPPFFARTTPLYKEKNNAIVLPESASLTELLNTDKIALYENKSKQRFVLPYPLEIDQFSKAVHLLLNLKNTGNSSALQEAASLLSEVNYKVYILQNRYFYLKENHPQNGWGIYAIDTRSTSNTLIEVPAPIDEPGSMEVGTVLYLKLNAHGLAISGSSKHGTVNSNANVLRSYQTMYQAFHHEVSRQDVLQIRTFSAEQVRVEGRIKGNSSVLGENLTSILRVKGSLPPGLKLGELKDALGIFDIQWGSEPLENVQRDSTRKGFAELVLSRADVRKLLIKLFFPKQDILLKVQDESIEGYLLSWIFDAKTGIAGSGSELYVPPKLEELLFFDQEVVTPILALMPLQYKVDHWTTIGLEELRLINASAKRIGYQLIRYHHKESGRDYLILTEIPDDKNRHYGGTYIFRLGSSSPYIIQVPRPLYEINSFEYGVALFESLNAKALLISGTHPNTNTDKSSDLLVYQNRINLFNLVSQIILRESGEDPLMVVQSRAFGVKPDITASDADVLVAFDDGAMNKKQLSTLENNLLQTLSQTGLKTTLVNGLKETAGYEASGVFQSLYTEQSKNKEFTVLWLSPALRSSFRQGGDSKLQEEQIVANGIKTVETGLYPYLKNLQRGFSVSVPPEMKNLLRNYLNEQDILLLDMIKSKWPDYFLEGLIDNNSKQFYLLVFNSERELILVVNMAPTDYTSVIKINSQNLPPELIKRYIETRSTWLELEEKP